MTNDTCQTCGHPLAEDAEFCQECGASARAPQPRSAARGFDASAVGEGAATALVALVLQTIGHILVAALAGIGLALSAPNQFAVWDEISRIPITMLLASNGFLDSIGPWLTGVAWVGVSLWTASRMTTSLSSDVRRLGQQAAGILVTYVIITTVVAHFVAVAAVPMNADVLTALNLRGLGTQPVVAVGQGIAISGVVVGLLAIAGPAMRFLRDGLPDAVWGPLATGARQVRLLVWTAIAGLAGVAALSLTFDLVASADTVPEWVTAVVVTLATSAWLGLDVGLAALGDAMIGLGDPLVPLAADAWRYVGIGIALAGYAWVARRLVRRHLSASSLIEASALFWFPAAGFVVVTALRGLGRLGGWLVGAAVWFLAALAIQWSLGRFGVRPRAATRECAQCGAAIAAGHRFCATCGSPVGAVG